jgi:hypothetical protein
VVFFLPKIKEIRPAIILITNDKRVFWFLLPMFYTAVKRSNLIPLFNEYTSQGTPGQAISRKTGSAENRNVARVEPPDFCWSEKVQKTLQ